MQPWSRIFNEEMVAAQPIRGVGFPMVGEPV